MRTIKTYFKGAPFYNAFHRTYPDAVEKTDISGGRITPRRDRGHIIDKDIEHIFSVDATASPVGL